VGDLYKGNEAPKVQEHDDIKNVIIEISSKRLGAAAVLDNEVLTGIITDGDLRRMLEKNPEYSSLKAVDIMSRKPRTIRPDTLVVDALSIMRNNNITQLLVVENRKYLGVIHLHDILREGIL
jgi:arabinose-5-phosphate isomerase